MKQHNKKEYFTDLYNQNFNYVFSYIYVRTGGNGQLTEDIVQETFTCAWFSLERFNNISSIQTWLCSIAKNKLRESYRKTLYKQKFESPEDDSITESASSYNLENSVLHKEMRQQIIKVLGAINPLYRYVIIMKYIDDMSVKEIAKVLGRTPKAVDGMLQRSKAAFEKEYSKMEGTIEEDE